MSIRDILFGKPIATSDERGEQVGVSAGIPIFGLDALSSAAYGPEAALTLLIPLGLAGVAYIVPISASIIALLAMFIFPIAKPLPPIRAGAAPIRLPRRISAPFPAC